MTDRPDDSLIAATEAALAATPLRVVQVEHGGERYIAKRQADRPRRLSQALLLRWLVKQVTRQAVPMRTLLLADATAGVGYEARRLAALAAAGVRVPRVVHSDASYLLMTHCGISVASLLDHWSVATCGVELDQLARELGAFHAAGHWHGGAQIKNLTRKDGEHWRIDFEEDFGERVPLPATQALDLVLFLNSVSMAGALREAESRALLPRLIDSYFAVNPDPGVRDAMRRALPWVTALTRMLSPFKGGSVNGRPRKGVARLVILGEALKASLPQR